MIRYRPSDDVVAREVGGEQVLLDMRSGTYFSLNAVGTAIWQAMEAAPADTASLREVVTAQFEVDAADAEADIASLLAELHDRGLIAPKC